MGIFDDEIIEKDDKLVKKSQVKLGFSFNPVKKEEDTYFTIGDIFYTYDYVREDFICQYIESIRKVGTSIMINGRFDKLDCFKTLHEAYMHECRNCTDNYHENLRYVSERYYKKEEELRKC